MPDVRLMADRMHALRVGVDPATDPDWRATVLLRLGEMFAEQLHAVTPWFALRWAYDHGLPQPEWVIRYLRDKSVEINTAVVDGGGQSEAAAVGRVLGFGAEGRGLASAASAAADSSRDWSLAYDVALQLAGATERGERLLRKTAISLAAERGGVSSETVKRAVRQYGAAAEEQVQLLGRNLVGNETQIS
jgi:hypothetical protein